MSIGNRIKDVSRQYPWLTEATMDKCLIVSDSRLANVRSALTNIKNKNKEMEGFIDEIDEALQEQAENRSDRARTFQNTVGRINDDVSGIIRSFDRSQNPVLTLGEQFETLSWAASGASGMAADAAKVGPLQVPFLAPSLKFLNWGTTALAGLATMGVFMTRFTLEHEKTVRGFIDYGGAAADLDSYTAIRDMYGTLGQSVAEALEIMSGSSSMFANVNGNLLKGYMDFGKFIQVTRNSKDRIDTLGYSTDALATRFLEEAEILRTVSDLRSFDNDQQKRIMKGFTSSTLIASMLSETTGDSRDALLAARQEALTDVDMMQAFNKNMDYMKSIYGENAVFNQREFLGMMPGLANMVGPELSDMIKDSLRRGVFDMQHNETIIDNMPVELINQLQLMGDDSLNDFVTFLDSGMKGELDPRQAVSGWQTLMIKTAGTDAIDLMPGDVNRQRALDLQAKATLLPDSFMKANFLDNEWSDENLKQILNVPAEAIHAVDSAAATLLSTLNEVAPDYKTTGFGVAGYGWALDKFIDGMAAMTPGDSKGNNRSFFESKGLTSGTNGNIKRTTLFPNGGNEEDMIKYPKKYKLNEVRDLGYGREVLIYWPASDSGGEYDSSVLPEQPGAYEPINFKEFEKDQLIKTEENKLNTTSSTAFVLSNSVDGIANLFDLNLKGLTA
jgi:hypothetical protein